MSNLEALYLLNVVDKKLRQRKCCLRKVVAHHRLLERLLPLLVKKGALTLATEEVQDRLTRENIPIRSITNKFSRLTLEEGATF